MQSILKARKTPNRDELNWGAAECPISEIRRCPAIILAANRTERVNGRITFLTISIITIKGIKTEGVPRGTKWAIVELGSIEFLRSMCPIQSGMARVQVKVKWEEEVKMKGNSPLKLLKEIKIKRANEGSIIPGEEILLLTAQNSLNTFNLTLFKSF